MKVRDSVTNNMKIEESRSWTLHYPLGCLCTFPRVNHHWLPFWGNGDLVQRNQFGLPFTATTQLHPAVAIFSSSCQIFCSYYCSCCCDYSCTYHDYVMSHEPWWYHTLPVAGTRISSFAALFGWQDAGLSALTRPEGLLEDQENS